MCAK